MTRSSPSVVRAAAILGFFADHPGQSFSMIDLVRGLKISRATCHALLTALVEVSYLYKASDKNYVLGPALARIGRVAADHASPLQIAQPEMRALADEFDAICSAYFRDGDDIVVRERAASVSHLGYSIPVGTRQKLREASSGIYYAWSPLDEVEAWLASLKPAPSVERRLAMERGMTFAREHGFIFYVRSAGGDSTGDPNIVPSSLSVELQQGELYPVAGVIAPVFDGQGRIAFMLGLVGFTAALTGIQVHLIGDRLREACDRITGFFQAKPL